MDPVTLSTVEALAPDQASIQAASRLRAPELWPLLAFSEARGLLWSECQGSGSTPYRVSVELADQGYKCSCPSRKFPCKHVLATLWLYAESPALFSPAEVPAWVDEWLGRRRRRPPGETTAVAAVKVSIAAAGAEDEAESVTRDPVAAAARADKARRKREAAIAVGLDQLDRWLLDQLRRGLAELAGDLQASCRTIARRLVDARAGGLGSRIDQLAADALALPESRRLDFLLGELGTLHLLGQAYRRQHRLPPGLRADVRAAVGWSVSREALLQDLDAPRVAGPWRVLGSRHQVQVDRLQRIETWLLRCPDQPSQPAQADPLPGFALLLDFQPAAAGAVAPPYRAGEVVDAELVFHPSAQPLRAVRGASPPDAALSAAPWPAVENGLAQALDDYRQRLARQPWLAAYPLQARVEALAHAPGSEAGDGLYLSDGELTLPLDPASAEAAQALAGVELHSVVGLWNGRGLFPLTVDTAIGRWHKGPL